MAKKTTPIERMFVQVFEREMNPNERKVLLKKPKKTRKHPKTVRKFPS